MILIFELISNVFKLFLSAILNLTAYLPKIYLDLLLRQIILVNDF